MYKRKLGVRRWRKVPGQVHNKVIISLIKNQTVTLLEYEGVLITNLNMSDKSTA